MKKNMFLAALLLGGVASAAFAQTTEIVTENKTVNENVTSSKGNSFWSNTFITVGVGGQMLFGDHDQQMKFGDRISPALDIAVGKWITPGVGVRLGYTGWMLNGATQNESLGNGKPLENKPWHGYWLYEQEVKYFNLHGDVMFNLSNLFCGYNPKRVWNCSPYIGFGLLRNYSGKTSSEIAANLGIQNAFRLSDAWDLNLDVRATMVNDDFDGERGGRSEEGILAVTVGATYKFKPRGWKQKVVTVYNNTELDRLRDRMNELNAENERLKKQAADTITTEVTKTEVVHKEVVAPCMVVFPIGKSELTQDARVNLGMFAENVKKADKGIVYTITGYADAATGNREINERLSKERARAVFDCLVEEFRIPTSQLKIDYKGGVGNMFYDNPEMSRAVIVKISSVPGENK